MKLPNDAGALHDLVMRNGGLFSTDMRHLSDARQVYRLGCHVRADMKQWLRSGKVGCWPTPLPNDARQQVLLYALDSDAGRAMKLAFRINELERKAAIECVA